MRKTWVLPVIIGMSLIAMMLAPLAGAKRDSRIGPRNLAGSGTPLQRTGLATATQHAAISFGKSLPVRELAKMQTRVSDPASVDIKDREELLEQRRAAGAKGGKDELSLFELGQQSEGTEKNFKNREIIRQFDPNAKTASDAAIAKVGSEGGTHRSLNIPGPTTSFEAISLTDTTALGQGFLPPDTVGEIGPNHFVQMVNSSFRIYNRAGTPAIPLTSIGALFSTVSGPCANSEDGDPIVMYDQMADRWILSEFCTVANPNNHQLIAVSTTGDPTGNYYVYDFMMPNNKFNDYPKFGVWHDGYYMTDNQFNQAGTQFLGAGIFAFDRTKMIAGDPTASFIYFDKAEGCPGNCQFGGMLPADIDGFVPPPAGAPAPVIQFDADEFGATDSLRIFDFHADFAMPANSTLTERTGSPLAVAAFDPREVPSGSRNVIPQPPAGIAVDAISDRLMNRLAYRNFGTHESLVMNHTVNAAVNPSFRAGVRYYEIRKTTPAGAWAVQEQATMAGAGGDTTHRWMGSTALNAAGSQAVGYSASSASVFPSIRYAGRLAGDPPGSLAQGEATLVAGTSSQTHSSGRWGDYSDMTVDPVDDCTFWYTQQYVTGAAAPDSTRWHTRVGAFQFGPCPAVQKGVLTGTITTSVGGIPIPNATISAMPFARTSNALGVYTIDPIGTGTYSVTVSAPLYTPVTISGVTITLGNTTTLNVSLDPLNVLTGGTPLITAESCAAPNGAIDPGETVTLDLPIINSGGLGASTTNLVATLQAVGGVASPSGPQNYGAVAQGAPAVVRPFSFTVSATCGSVVAITLQLQDGANNLGTIVYNLRTGILGAPSLTTISTGNIATPIPDLSSVDIPMVVSQNGAVADVNVKVRLNHTFDSDVTMQLIAPDGTIVILAANRGGNGDNYGTGLNDCSGVPTIFDDAAALPISSGIAPFAGTFRPESALAALNGTSINGTWKLRVSDNAALDTGTVGCVTLEISRQPFVCCGVLGTPLINSGGSATITAESVTPNNMAPDPGETVTASFPLINAGDGNTSNLVATLQATGGVTPVTATANYGVVVAGGPPVSRPFTFVANGSCGSMITATLQLQDGAINLGTVNYTFQLGTTSTASQTFSNSTAIIIPATGTGATTGAPANPYPSNITVAGIMAPVSKVAVTLKNISHSFPSDVDVLLVGPTGVKFIVMSDVIGGTDWTGETYTFTDDAAAILPSSGAPPATGSFRPTNYGAGDVFPAPAPAGPYLTPQTAGMDTLNGAFGGLNPNGTWSLYVVDDAGTDTGQFAGGWDLTITTSQSACNTQTCSLTCPANITVPADLSGLSAVVNFPAANPTGACGVLGYTPASGSTFPLGTTTVTVNGANAASCTFTVTVLPGGAASSQMNISEFRLRGPAGVNDEFVELYNTGNSPLTVNASDASAGWSLVASDGVARFVIPNGTVIPAHGHYLGANTIAVTGYSLSNYGGAGAATPDASYLLDIADDAGLALFSSTNPVNFTLANRLDAVGPTTAPALYREGAGLPSVSTGALEYSFVRDNCGKGGSTSTLGPCPSGGNVVDTDNNSVDFYFVDTAAGNAGAGQRLGAPGPENLASAIQRNLTIPVSLVFPCMGASDSPNRIRDNTPDPANNSTLGTLEIRRKFTNMTGAPITRLRFRMVDLSTALVGGGDADLRVRTGSALGAIADPCGTTVSIEGTALETPPNQAIGGGFNSSLSVSSVTTAPIGGGKKRGTSKATIIRPDGSIELETPLPNGNSINVRFLLGVQQSGRFKFFINVEALP